MSGKYRTKKQSTEKVNVKITILMDVTKSKLHLFLFFCEFRQRIIMMVICQAYLHRFQDYPIFSLIFSERETEIVLDSAKAVICKLL